MADLLKVVDKQGFVKGTMRPAVGMEFTFYGVPEVVSSVNDTRVYFDSVISGQLPVVWKKIEHLSIPLQQAKKFGFAARREV